MQGVHGPEGSWEENREKPSFAMFVTTWAVPTLAPWVPAFQLPWVRGTDCPTPPGSGPSGGEAEAGGPASAASGTFCLQGSTKGSTQGSRAEGCWLRLAGVAELTGRTLAEGRWGLHPEGSVAVGRGGGPLDLRPGEGRWSYS